MLAAALLFTGCAEKPMDPRSSNRDIVGEMADLSEQKQQAAAELEKANSNIASARSQLALVEADRSDSTEVLNNEIDDKASLLSDTKTEIAGLEQQLANANNNQARQISELLNSRKAIAANQQATINRLEKDLVKVKEESDNEIKNLNNEIAEVTKVYDQEIAKAKELETKNKEIVSELKDLESANEELKSEFEGLEETNKKLTQQVADAEAEISQLETQVSELTTKNQGILTQIQDMKFRFDDLKTQTSILSAEFEQTKTGMAQAREILRNLENNINNVKAEQNRTKAEIDRVKREKAAAEKAAAEAAAAEAAAANNT